VPEVTALLIRNGEISCPCAFLLLVVPCWCVSHRFVLVAFVDFPVVMISAAAVMALAPAAQKSSLEVLLETIKKRDEQPKDTPPALPARPTCRGRLPTSRRPSLPSGFKLDNGLAKEAAAATMPVDKKSDVDKDIAVLEAKEEKAVKGCIFGAKRKFSSAEVLDESPYVANFPENRKEVTVCEDPPSVSLAMGKMDGKPVCTDIMDYVLQKVMCLSFWSYVLMICYLLSCKHMEVG
jgi:myosin V